MASRLVMNYASTGWQWWSETTVGLTWILDVPQWNFHHPAWAVGSYCSSKGAKGISQARVNPTQVSNHHCRPPSKIIGCTLMHRVPVLGDRRHHDGRGKKKLADFLCHLCRMAKVSEVNSNANIIIKMFSFHQILVLVWFVAHFVKPYKEFFRRLYDGPYGCISCCTSKMSVSRPHKT